MCSTSGTAVYCDRLAMALGGRTKRGKDGDAGGVPLRNGSRLIRQIPCDACGGRGLNVHIVSQREDSHAKQSSRWLGSAASGSQIALLSDRITWDSRARSMLRACGAYRWGRSDLWMSNSRRKSPPASGGARTNGSLHKPEQPAGDLPLNQSSRE